MNKDEVKLSELPEVYQTIAELIGFENMVILAETYDGEYVYFPKIESLRRYSRNKKIVDEFNGANYKALARKYGLTETHVRSIIRDSGTMHLFRPSENQITMFDEEESL